MLDLALAHGWRPGGVEPPELSYAAARGQRVEDEDARALARSIDAGLSSVADQEQPLSDRPLGPEDTERRIASAGARAPR